MKPAAEFEEINGRFEPINDMLAVCKEKAQVTSDTDSLALVRAVQALTKEVRNLERKLLADDLASHKIGA